MQGERAMVATKLAVDSPYAPGLYEAAYQDFAGRFPTYADSSHLDELRAREYSRLDRLGHVYLDYTGGGLYAESQLRRHHELLSDGVFGNPHSHNPTSLASTTLVEEARAAVLDFFNASPEEYTVVFTTNASGALKLVGEAYPFGPGGRYLLSFDNHNSVNGIREFARRRGAQVTYIPVNAADLRLDASEVARQLEVQSTGQPRLFSYPAQSNFSGVQHPLEWIAQAQAHGWDVLLDAAAFVPTNRLDLSRVKPDFVSLSFYKIFGYPTGIGVLLARQGALAKLQRPWFAGGTITIASVQDEGWHQLIPGAPGFEDGTVNYLGLPAVTLGLQHVGAAGIDHIHRRVADLTGWLLAEMQQLYHANGTPLVRIFGPTTLERRGGTISLNLLAPDAQPFDVHRVEELAGAEKISVRTGCFCNPGDGEVAHGLTHDDMAPCFGSQTAPRSFADFYQSIRARTGKTPSTLRVSLGIASNFADAYRLMQFIAGFRDRVTI
jgi:selenocysteine lyase/cysteine desulfurase